MRLYRVGALIAGAILAPPAWAQAQTDQDTLRAMVYNYLSESVANNGMSSDTLPAAANTAQDYHLAQNPAEDPQRYALTVIDGAQSLRDALANGRITMAVIMDSATNCNDRYSH